MIASLSPKRVTVTWTVPTYPASMKSYYKYVVKFHPSGEPENTMESYPVRHSDARGNEAEVIITGLEPQTLYIISVVPYRVNEDQIEEAGQPTPTTEVYTREYSRAVIYRNVNMF